MKKNNANGFFLVETLIVTTIVALSMVFLYTQIVKLIDGYELRLTYNTVNGVYAATEFNKYIINDSTLYLDLTSSLNADGYNEVLCTDFTSSDYCNAMVSTLNIENMYITKYNTSAIKTNAPDVDEFSQDLKLFISNIKSESNALTTEYRMIVEFNNGEFATIKLNPGFDTTPPTITGDEILYITAGETHNPTEGLVEKDNKYEDISSNIICTLDSGTTYNCTVEDSSGNLSAVFTRTITAS